MKSIFGKIFSGQLASAFVILAFMAFIFLFAIRASITSWNNDKKYDIENLMIPAISKTYRLSGSLSPTELSNALLPFITDSLYVYVFDKDRNPILLIEHGKTTTIQEVEKTIGPLSSFLSLNKPSPIKEADAIIGYLCVDSIDFLAYKANRIFIATMRKAVLAGSIIAIIFTVVLSEFISGAFSKKTSLLADSIASPALLRDDIELEKTGINEFDKIVSSVSGLKKRLKQEEQLRNQWMQDISHDLRTPLTAVKMQIEGMKDGVLAAGKERFEALYSELMLIERLVLDLQDLSRFESPEMKISPVKISIEKFIESIDERFSFMAEKKRIRYSSAFIHPDGITSLYADPILLQRCVSNIVQNAFQYTPENGSIDFRIEIPEYSAAEDRKIKITVKNTGFISEVDLPHIFDRLYRGDHSRSTAGSGLGLSIVSAIVRLHNGTITIENRNENSGQFVLTEIKLPAESSAYNT